ncbi:hypothetical protein RvY_13827 [Ramazzottius varieornatus]|uniref:Uncharacterized protein n=1 Tax=Ramazzottius varieornatus TaxID=947166 RepID=A0A1D1VUG7_RAMVA|nr:hypothetical protein RvY_13827 [Ramazzottius varieornatus]
MNHDTSMGQSSQFRKEIGAAYKACSRKSVKTSTYPTFDADVYPLPTASAGVLRGLLK